MLIQYYFQNQEPKISVIIPLPSLNNPKTAKLYNMQENTKIPKIKPIITKISKEHFLYNLVLKKLVIPPYIF